MTKLALPRRLPGIAFESAVPPLAESLPRMDIAVFVGFASAGPVHVPVAVEDAAQFTDIFGADLPLAWDEEKGRQVYAYLAPVVRSFFRNGGRRCWVIRVELPVSVNGHWEFARCFLDPDLRHMGTEQFMEAADFLCYQSPSPRSLVGIHAALEIEEASLIAVPDATHLDWALDIREEELPHENSEAPSVPGALFSECRLHHVDAPTLSIDRLGPNSFVLSWTKINGATYTVEESVSPDWSASQIIYRGSDNFLKVVGYPCGRYYYRSYADVEGTKSRWSNSVIFQQTGTLRWKIKDPSAYSSDELMEVHRALLRMCAARGDLFAVLSLPEHYRPGEAMRYVEALKFVPGSATGLRSAGGRDSPELSFGAVYHPWLVGREEGETVFRSIPPDGGICGIIAKRALARGAWVAPANELMTGVLTLTPPIEDVQRLELQQTHINLVRQEPYGFVTLSADTLSDDPDLRPVNVRRLLMLLRRLALRLGTRYVFEPSDDSLRRMVRCGFETLLDDMFMRGAFASNTPAASYQVVTSPSINTPESMDQGRFIVELKVAPSLPMTFLTIRLLQTGERLSVSEGS
jgi:hypothetical protein